MLTDERNRTQSINPCRVLTQRLKQLDPNCVCLSSAPPPSLDLNRIFLSLELVLAFFPPQSRFIQDGGVGGRSGAAAKINVSSFSIICPKQRKHGYEVKVVRKEIVAESPERKGITRVARDLSIRIRPLDFDHGHDYFSSNRKSGDIRS